MYKIKKLIKRDGPLVVIIKTFESSNFVLSFSQRNIMRVKELASSNVTKNDRLVYAPKLHHMLVRLKNYFKKKE